MESDDYVDEAVNVIVDRTIHMQQCLVKPRSAAALPKATRSGRLFLNASNLNSPGIITWSGLLPPPSPGPVSCGPVAFGVFLAISIFWGLFKKRTTALAICPGQIKLE